MPKYKYRAKGLDDRMHTGIQDAADTSALYNILRQKSLTLIESSEVQESEQSRYRLKSNEVAEFSRQMADMLGSGLTVVKAIGILRERDFKPKLIRIYDALYRDIMSGLTLSEALKLNQRSFPSLFIDMVASGEASGQMEKSLRKMAEHYTKEHRLNSKARSAMMYPAILAVVTVLVVIVIFTFVLPTFFDIFKDMELPLITRIVMGASKAITGYWIYILLFCAMLAAIWNYLLTLRSVRRAFDHFKLKVPIMGKLLRTIYTARFARGLSTLYSSGLPLVSALNIASSLIGNAYIEDQFPDVIKEIRNGDALSSSLKKVDGFDGKLSSTIVIGEESGRLANMLESVADSYDFEAEAATDRLVTLIQPVMIIIMAVIVGGIMLAVMIPIFQLYSSF